MTILKKEETYSMVTLHQKMGLAYGNNVFAILIAWSLKSSQNS